MNNLNEVRSGIANYQPRHRQDYIEDAHSHQHIRSNISQYERKSKLSRQHVSDGLTRFIHALSWGCGKAVFLAIMTPPNWVSIALGHTHFTHLFLWLEWQYQHSVHDFQKRDIIWGFAAPRVAPVKHLKAVNMEAGMLWKYSSKCTSLVRWSLPTSGHDDARWLKVMAARNLDGERLQKLASSKRQKRHT